MKIIGLAGKKRVGKSTTARFLNTALAAKHRTTFVLSFAGPIRSIGTIFGWSQDQMLINKDEIHSVWGISWRKFAQQIGTDVFRGNWRADTWLRVMDITLAHIRSDYVIIDDVRFDNECDFIYEKNGFIINIIRDVDDGDDTHASEAGVSEWNLTLMNMDTLDTLKKRCEEIIEHEQDGWYPPSDPLANDPLHNIQEGEGF